MDDVDRAIDLLAGDVAAAAAFIAGVQNEALAALAAMRAGDLVRVELFLTKLGRPAVSRQAKQGVESRTGDETNDR